MLNVPNVRIVIRAQDNKCSVVEKPRWYADMYKAVWGSKLEPGEEGCEITELPEDTPEAFRYTTFDRIETLARETVAFFSNGEPKRLPKMAEIFQRLFPDGLEAIVKKLREDDIIRAGKAREKGKIVAKAHESFVQAGLTEAQSLNLQLKGFPNLGACESATPMLLGDAGLTPIQAIDLIEKAKAARAETEKLVREASLAKAK